MASLGGILFGFDTAVISGTVEQVKTQYGLTTLVEGWFTSSALVGCMLGAAAAGYLADRIGRKPSLIAAAFFFFFSGLGSAIPPSFGLLVLARIACGVGIGMASVIAPMYISEISPAKWRGRLGGLYQLFIVLGILLAYLSNWCILRFAQDHKFALGPSNTLQWLFVSQYWRGMFGAEIMPAIFFLLLLFNVPESPRWLIQTGQESLGFEILARLNDKQVAENELQTIRDGLHQHSGSIRELFRPGLRKALLVGVMLSVLGQLSGVNVVVYYGPQIMMAAGYQSIGALLGQVGFGFINLVFTLIALLVIDRWGRRPLLINGMAVVAPTMVVTGVLFLAGHTNTAALINNGAPLAVSRSIGLWIGVMLCIYMACVALSICAVVWVVTPEIFPTRIRGSAVSIVTFTNWAANSLSALLFPWFVASFGMHSFFFTTAGICTVATVFFWKYLPETKGCSLEAIEKLWLKQTASLPTLSVQTKNQVSDRTR